MSPGSAMPGKDSDAKSTQATSDSSETAEAPASRRAARRERKRRKKDKSGRTASDSAADPSQQTSRSDTGSKRGDSVGGADVPRDSTTGSPPPRKGGRALTVLALLLALAAGAAAGYLGWRVMQLEQRVTRIPEQRQTALEPLATQDAVAALEQQLQKRGETLERRIEEQVGALEQQLARADQERSDAIAQLRQRVETAETAVQSIRDRRARDEADWRMAEVRYLVSMAVRQLEITGNVAGAIAALEAADQALGQMGDPRVLDLRERIVEDIGSLRAVEPADVEGVALRVQNLAPRIPDLVRTNAATANDAPASGAGPDGSAGAATNDSVAGEGWWGALSERLAQLVTIRREPEPTPPTPDPAAPAAPTPSAELPAAERLLLALREASRAALNHEPQAYASAIERALEIVSAEYADGAPANQRFREELGALQEHRVATQLPDLTPTLERTQTLAARLNGGTSAAERER